MTGEPGDLYSLPSNSHWIEADVAWPEPPPWHADAACRGVSQELFFPTRGEESGPAKQICGGCPVRGDCLDYALDSREVFGIWGGTSERERRNLRVGRKRGSQQEERRRQVRSMAELGRSSTEIARELGIARRTVYRYLEEAS